MPFTINVLIGSPPTDQTPLDAVEYKSLIGQIFNFVAPLEMNDQGALSSSCANCEVQAEEKTESTGEVVLTNALITRYKQKLVHDNPEGANQVLLSMEPTDVINFLKSNLNWQINAVSNNLSPSILFESAYVTLDGWHHHPARGRAFAQDRCHCG